MSLIALSWRVGPRNARVAYASRVRSHASPRRCSPHWLALGLALGWLLVCTGPARADGRGPVERSLLQRVFSPCCYRETLDVHVSPIADQLRMELHERLARGESSAALERRLVARYGERVLTQPPSGWASAGWLAVAVAVVSGGLFAALRRERSVALADPRASILDDRELADRLADDLARLD